MRNLDDEYKIVGIVGVGGMGSVHSVKRVSDDAIFAMKTLHTGVALQQQGRTRFLHEIELLQLVAGPFILEYIDSGVHQGRVALVTKLHPSTVGAWASYNVVPLQQNLRWMSEVCIALDRIHGKGVVHRDLKPTNIMLNEDNFVRLGDFGIARHPHVRITLPGRSMGTPVYSSQQQQDDGGDATCSDDLFSVGMMIATLQLRIHANVVKQHQDKTALLAEVPQCVTEIILRATHEDPAMRYLSAAEMLYDIISAMAKVN